MSCEEFGGCELRWVGDVQGFLLVWLMRVAWSMLRASDSHARLDQPASPAQLSSQPPPSHPSTLHQHHFQILHYPTQTTPAPPPSHPQAQPTQNNY